MNTNEEIVQFIRSLYKTDDFIPLHEPTFSDLEKSYVNEAIDSTFVSSVGKFVDQFEHEFADYTGASHAVAVVNGTAALHISLLLAGVQVQDEVITQSLTFVATCNAISYCGAQPIFLDVDQKTMGLSAQALRDFLESHTEQVKGLCQNKATAKVISACVPMHTFGHACQIEELAEICKEYNIALVEDAAESLGSYANGQHTGTIGTVGAFSFNGNKVMTTGGGGMIVTNDTELARKAKHLTTTAKVPHKWNISHDSLAYNYRLPNLNAALGCAQLERLPEILVSKRKLAKTYKDFFAEVSSCDFIEESPGDVANYWLNTLKFNSREERDSFLAYTNEKGIMTRPAWAPMHELPMFAHCQKASSLLETKACSELLVNIPSSPLKEFL